MSGIKLAPQVLVGKGDEFGTLLSNIRARAEFDDSRWAEIGMGAKT